MVKIGLIGCGRWGKRHAETLAKHPGGCQLVGIADTDERTRAVADSLKVDFFADYSDLLPRVDAVSVVVPTAFHFPVVRICLLQGKHVLVEKPVTLDSRTTQELVRMAEERRLILSVGYIFRFHPVVQAVKKMLPSLGDVAYLTARYVGGQNRLWADSGAILNFGIHLIDILNFILPVRPKKVYAQKRNLIDEKREDSATVVLVYENFPATLELSCLHPEKARELEIVGRDGSIIADFERGTMRTYRTNSNSVTRPDFTSENFEVGNPLERELAHFVKCIDAHAAGLLEEIVNIGKEET